MLSNKSKQLLEERKEWLKFHELPGQADRLHSGPTIVNQMAAKFREAGIPAMAGTEHVIVKAPGKDFYERQKYMHEKLVATHGTHFGMLPAFRNLPVNESKSIVLLPGGKFFSGRSLHSPKREPDNEHVKGLKKWANDYQAQKKAGNLTGAKETLDNMKKKADEHGILLRDVLKEDEIMENDNDQWKIPHVNVSAELKGDKVNVVGYYHPTGFLGKRERQFTIPNVDRKQYNSIANKFKRRHGNTVHGAGAHYDYWKSVHASSLKESLDLNEEDLASRGWQFTGHRWEHPEFPDHHIHTTARSFVHRKNMRSGGKKKWEDTIEIGDRFDLASHLDRFHSSKSK